MLGTDGNLWMEHAGSNGKFGAVPPPREQIDGNVQAFQALSDTEAFVLGTDGNLWMEHAGSNGKFGAVPPPREQIDGNVQAFQGLSDTEAIVLGTDGNLWMEHAGSNGKFGAVPPHREQIDGNAIALQALSSTEVFVLGSDRKLWLEHAGSNGKFGAVPAPREQIDGNVEAFQALSDTEAMALGTDGNLWMEHAGSNGKFGAVPPPREHVDGNVMQPLLVVTALAVTELQMQYQLMKQWCWIAVATSISLFYNRSSPWTQCSLLTAQLQANPSLNMLGSCCPGPRELQSDPALAAALANPYQSSSEYALQSLNLGLDATPTGICDHSGDIAKALTQTGNLKQETGSAVGFTDLFNELSAGNPVCINIDWSGGSSHLIAVSGDELPDTVIVEDPVNGRWVGQYETLLTSYLGSGSWTNSFYTQS